VLLLLMLLVLLLVRRLPWHLPPPAWRQPWPGTYL
jgi:hypothetical protein